jgi:hypothetical protein
MRVTSATANNSGKRAVIKFSGLWLNNMGFETNDIIKVSSEPQNLLFELHSKDAAIYSTAAKSLLKKKSNLIQVQKVRRSKKDVPVFDVKGKWVESLGFTIGSAILIEYDFGIINVKLIGLDKFTNL